MGCVFVCVNFLFLLGPRKSISSKQPNEGGDGLSNDEENASS